MLLRLYHPSVFCVPSCFSCYFPLTCIWDERCCCCIFVTFMYYFKKKLLFTFFSRSQFSKPLALNPPIHPLSIPLSVSRKAQCHPSPALSDLRHLPALERSLPTAALQTAGQRCPSLEKLAKREAGSQPSGQDPKTFAVSGTLCTNMSLRVWNMKDIKRLCFLCHMGLCASDLDSKPNVWSKRRNVLDFLRNKW